MNTQPFGPTDQIIELSCEYLSVRCIWLYVVFMSRTRFRVNPQSIWVWVQLQLLKLQISRLFRARSSLKFRQLWSVDSLRNTYMTWQEHIVRTKFLSYIQHSKKLLGFCDHQRNYYYQIFNTRTSISLRSEIPENWCNNLEELSRRKCLPIWHLHYK